MKTTRISFIISCLLIVLYPLTVSCQTETDTKKITSDNLSIKPSLSTPQKSWETLLAALKTGDSLKIKSVVTENGFKHLSILDYSDSNHSQEYKDLANKWSKWKTSCEETNTDKINNSKTYMFLAGPSAESLSVIFYFELTGDGWKLDKWVDGLY